MTIDKKEQWLREMARLKTEAVTGLRHQFHYDSDGGTNVVTAWVIWNEEGFRLSDQDVEDNAE